jgi:formylglycine-generating enzyme required for sulfatase activity
VSIRRLIVILCIPLLLLTIEAGAQKEKPPYRDADQALALFAKEFVSITPGQGKFPASFRMGSPPAGDERTKSEMPVHTVKISQPFALAKYEVTQELYKAVMGKNPAKWQGPRNSVEMVGHAEAEEFCRKVTEQMRKRKLLGADEVIRLPSEAEWEYCCRAGTTSDFSFGDGKIEDYCWYAPNSPGNDPPVGSKKPNLWGLHEMHGYVWEWVQDSWHADYRGAPEDGSAWFDKDAREYVIRGGAFNSPKERCRSAARESRAGDFRKDDLGFRCVRVKVK